MRSILAIGLIGVLALCAAVVASSCGGSKTRKVSVAAGEYYAEDEYDMLSGREQDRYCSDLNAELNSSQQEFESKTEEIQETKDLIESIRKQIAPLEREVILLDAEIRTLNDQIREVEELPKVWKVRAGDTLTLIAKEVSVYNDIDKWWRIFEANMDKIEDPYYIFPDTVLAIPRDWPTD